MHVRDPRQHLCWCSHQVRSRRQTQTTGRAALWVVCWGRRSMTRSRTATMAAPSTGDREKRLTRRSLSTRST